MKKLPYDGALNMLIEPPIPFEQINVEKLEFLRFMLVTGRLADGEVVSQPTGELVDFLAAQAQREMEAEEAAA